MTKLLETALTLLIIGVTINFYVSKQCYMLHVCPYDNEYMINYYSKYKNKHLGDSGIDIVIPYNISVLPHSYQRIQYHTQFVMTSSGLSNYKSYSYYLFARSSMQNYPLIYVNGVGIIDAGFRGNLSSLIFNPNDFAIDLSIGQKIVQICASDLSEIKVIVNCDIPTYGSRGSKGFGSTS